MEKITLKDLSGEALVNKRVLVRVDFNVPLDDHQDITDDTRIRAVLPTINYLLDEHAKVILISHLGRPKGLSDPKLSLAPVAKRLKRLLKKEIRFLPNCIGPEVEQAVGEMHKGDILLLENLRFHKGESANSDTFAASLGALADVYINDAFATAHRSHASNVAVTNHVPISAAGMLMTKEIRYFEQAMEQPTRPLVAILGGAKVSTKIGVIENLLKKVDKVIIGGGMAFTFYKAQGYEVGKSLVESDMVETALSIIKEARRKKVKFYLPVDCVVADKLDAKAETKIVPIQEIPEYWLGLDIGPATTKLFSEALQDAKTIIWNGPMGVFEIDAFSRGTMAMVHSVAESYALTIVGGGDTDVAVHRSGESYKFSYISTAGGAFLQLMEGKNLPAIQALTNRS
jgi:phosphoglycerate kinase